MWKYKEDKTKPIITAEKHIASTHYNLESIKLPKTAVLFFMHSGIDYLLNHYNCTLITSKLPRFLQGCPVYKLNDNICFLDGGRGAPQAVDTIETLKALGVKNIISVGLCGGFSNILKESDIIVPASAYIEEGTSLHYYEDIKYSYPTKTLSSKLRSILNAKDYSIVSTDSIYRQTYYKEELWRNLNLVGVDMETSAIFSVGAYLRLNIASILMVSDNHPLEQNTSNWKWNLTDEMRLNFFKKVTDAIIKITDM